MKASLALALLFLPLVAHAQAGGPRKGSTIYPGGSTTPSSNTMTISTRFLDDLTSVDVSILASNALGTLFVNSATAGEVCQFSIRGSLVTEISDSSSACSTTADANSVNVFYSSTFKIDSGTSTRDVSLMFIGVGGSL